MPGESRRPARGRRAARTPTRTSALGRSASVASRVPSSASVHARDRKDDEQHARMVRMLVQGLSCCAWLTWKTHPHLPKLREQQGAARCGCGAMAAHWLQRSMRSERQMRQWPSAAATEGVATGERACRTGRSVTEGASAEGAPAQRLTAAGEQFDSRSRLLPTAPDAEAKGVFGRQRRFEQMIRRLQNTHFSFRK